MKRLVLVIAGAQSFRPEDRVRKHREFVQRLPQTRKLRLAHFLVVMKPNPWERPRLGLSVGKERGGAVERNRIKRRLREFFRRNKDRFPPSRDLIIIALKGSSPLTYHQVVEELTPLLV